MIMPSQGLVSPQRPVSLLLSHTHHFHSLSEGKTKPHHGADDSDLVFFDIRLDSVTLTEPGLAALAEFVWMCTFVNTYWFTCTCMQLQLLHWKTAYMLMHKFTPVLMRDSKPASFLFPFIWLWFSERLFSAFFSWISLPSNILPQRDATLSDDSFQSRCRELS